MLHKIFLLHCGAALYCGLVYFGGGGRMYHLWNVFKFYICKIRKDFEM
jgi:hypothetical protein